MSLSINEIVLRILKNLCVYQFTIETTTAKGFWNTLPVIYLVKIASFLIV